MTVGPAASAYVLHLGAFYVLMVALFTPLAVGMLVAAAAVRASGPRVSSS